MTEVKQVKVDNWGVFFLHRLKMFFNRTDHCDLTLQFRDYAQLKVHRLVLNACTKYFEGLERDNETTFESNLLVMPDYLQADVVVPIVNFMYTGQLEYDYALYDRLYAAARVMNMNVLTKLLDAQKATPTEQPTATQEQPPKKEMILMNSRLDARPASYPSNYDKTQGRKYGPAPGYRNEKVNSASDVDVARPTRYELPEGLDNDDTFESSFADISYESLPIIKPLKRKADDDRRQHYYDEASSSRKFEELKKGVSYKRPRLSPETNEAKRIDLAQVNEYAYQQKLRSEYVKEEEDEDDDDNNADSFVSESYQAQTYRPQNAFVKSPQKENKSSTASVSLNHAKIISEVLKKYPHLVKSNKNIKLKIMNNKEGDGASSSYLFESNKPSYETPPRKEKEDSNVDWVYVSRNHNTESMARLVALGIENTAGPWLCLICGTPTKALKFLTYNKFYRHLVDHHKEKLPPKICEYCGFKSGKRNHLLHHMYTKHNIPPPPNYHFPKCNHCSYVALTEAFLIKHKMSHVDNKDFTCSVCNSAFRTRVQLLNHIHSSGHKICPDRRTSTKCAYCSKMFLREANLYTHLKLSHKEIARRDGIIDNSDEDEDDHPKYKLLYEHSVDKRESNGKITQKLLNSELYSKSIVNKDYDGQDKNYSEPMHIIETVEQNAKLDALGSVGESISSSINLVDVVVFQDNDAEYAIPESKDQISQQIIVSEQSSNVKTTKAKLHQPVQILVSGNQQYGSDPNVYADKTVELYDKSMDADSTKYIEAQLEQMENSQDGQIVVINEEDFRNACSQSSDGSNIVVLYRQEDGKQYIQQNESFEPLAHEEEVHMQQSDSLENAEQVHIISEHDLVHETVETWHEETVEETSVETRENEAVVAQDNAVDENKPEEEVIQEHLEIPLETSEITVSSNSLERHDDGMDVDEHLINGENVESTSAIEDCISSELQIQEEKPMNTEPEVEVKDCESSNLESLPVSEENVEKSADLVVAQPPIEVNDSPPIEENDLPPIGENDSLPIGENDSLPIEENDSPPIEENDMPAIEENNPPPIEESNSAMEVEESIENIEEEIKKQSQDNESESNQNNINNNIEEVIKEKVEEIPAVDEAKENFDENDADKTKSVEKISHLLNDWEDNDSQSQEMLTVVENKEESAAKDSNIEKLVSDWDDEDEK